MIDVSNYAKFTVFFRGSHIIVSVSYLKHCSPYLYTFFLISSKLGAINSNQFRPTHPFLNIVASPNPNNVDIIIFPVSVRNNFSKAIISTPI